MARKSLIRFSKFSLQDALDANLKSITLYRIVLAFLVFVSHSYPIFLGRPDPQIPFFWRSSVSFGTFAVGGFFALSGLLLYSSAKNLPPRVWIIRRSLRLLPAYVACLLFCSFIIGPFTIFVESGSLANFFNFSPIGPFAYTWNNLFLPIGITYALNDTFSNTPYGILTGGASVVNGSIWSLPYEIRCYLVLWIVLYLFSSSLRDKILPLLAFLSLSGYLFSGNTHFQRLVAPLWKFSDPLFLQLLSIFLIGACFGVYAKKITLNYITLFLVISLYFLSSYNYKFVSSIGVALTLLIPFTLRKLGLKRSQERNFTLWDISYGFYLYSFPIKQLTVSLLPNLAFLSIFFISLAVTLLLSILSYKVIESPSILLGKTFRH